MALVQIDDDPWTSKHDACEELYREVRSQLAAWGGSSADRDRLSADVRLKLNRFQSDVLSLSDQLARITREQAITGAEGERRWRQIEVLQSKLLQLKNQFNGSIQSSHRRHDNFYDNDDARRQLLGDTEGKNRKGIKTVNWGTGSDDEELIDSSEAGVSDFKNDRSRVINDQERGLEELSKIISRQRNIAENIANEVALQNDIIDDLGDQIDRTDNRILSETGQIRVIGNKDNTCGYWTVIILLFITIVVIAIVF